MIITARVIHMIIMNQTHSTVNMLNLTASLAPQSRFVCQKIHLSEQRILFWTHRKGHPFSFKVMSYVRSYWKNKYMHKWLLYRNFADTASSFLALTASSWEKNRKEGRHKPLSHASKIRPKTVLTPEPTLHFSSHSTVFQCNTQNAYSWPCTYF